MKLVVVGDTLLDVDLIGTVSRLCPDAPAPVLDVQQREVRAGGAGLAARLAGEESLAVTLVTVLADDQAGHELRDELAHIDTVVGPSPAPTPVKTRLRCAGRSLCRFDEGCQAQAPSSTENMLDAIKAADAVLVSDYGRGLMSDPRLREVLSQIADNVPIVWDPHPNGSQPISRVSLTTPNCDEAVKFLGIAHSQSLSPEDLASDLCRMWQAKAVAVTLGGQGAVLDSGGTPLLIPASYVDTYDPCGAGDRFAVAAVSRLAAGDQVSDAVVYAVHSATQFLAQGGVSRFGSRQITTLDSRSESPKEASDVVEAVRARGGTVVASGGCFDLLHPGHVRTLMAASELGDCLIVLVNSDRSARRLKGATKPINTESDRAELLRSLACVDAVIIFDEDTPETVLGQLRPDVWVKGGDYSATDELPEERLLRSWGGRTVLMPYHASYSTTKLVDEMEATG